MNRRNKTNVLVRTENFSGCGLSRARTTRPAESLSRTGQAGFTIVEVMVAVVVFAVGLLAIAGMQTQSIGQSSFSEQMSMRVNAITHRAETLKRMSVKDETFHADDGSQINAEVSSLFEKENMCDYGEECSWDYVDYADDKPYTVRQRVTQGYPLPELIMVEIEVVPRGVNDYKTKQRTVHVAYVRSSRWN
jgi:prepilin-type N-terminal cleavage/methylation domain-containing protein